MPRTTRSPWLPPTDPDEGKLWLSWLVRLRWLALFAQGATLGFVFNLLHSWEALVAWGATMGALFMYNGWTIARMDMREEVPEAGVLAQLLVDVLALTVFFAISGGPENPFVPLYLVHVAMGAVMLSPPKAAGLTAAVLLGHSALFVWHLPLHLENHSLPPDVDAHGRRLGGDDVTVLSVVHVRPRGREPRCAATRSSSSTAATARRAPTACARGHAGGRRGPRAQHAAVDADAAAAPDHAPPRRRRHGQRRRGHAGQLDRCKQIVERLLWAPATRPPAASDRAAR
jgi:hypothetical protein